MGALFSASTIERIAARLGEPGWMTELRVAALARHEALPWPHPSDDIWRRTDVSLLDPVRHGFAPAEPTLLARLPLTEPQLAGFTRPLGSEHLYVRAGGAWLSQPAVAGVSVEELTQAATAHPETVRRTLEQDGFTEPEQKFAALNAAFHHDDVLVEIPAGASVAQPVRVVHLAAAAAKQALFPMTLIHVGAGSSVTLIDEYVSLLPPGASGEPHVVNSRIDIHLAPGASLRYVRLQHWDRGAREFLLQRAVLERDASLTMANLNLGASLSKAHLITRLIGERASSHLYGFIFGQGRQHVDQHTLQDHQAPRTSSELQFRAALQDESRMVYTGLIRIAKEAAQTQAYQANHNLLLSASARAETIPMLEILADDVQCKHGASIGPIDEEQAFYLMSRGVPRRAAERLVVMGFVEPVIQQVPFEPLQERLRSEIEGHLHQAG